MGLAALWLVLSMTVVAPAAGATYQASTYEGAVMSDEPSGYWKLNEPAGPTVFDATGRNMGVYASVPTLGRAGLAPGSEGAAYFVADRADYASIPSSPPLSPSDRVSLEVWIRIGMLPRGSPGSVERFASIMTKAESYSLQLNGPHLELTIMQEGARRRLLAPVGAVRPAETHHVVGTYDGATQRLYVDGAEAAHKRLSGEITVNDNPLTIGSWDGAAVYFTGMIDEPAVYVKTLSSARVTAHFRSGRTFRPPTK